MKGINARVICHESQKLNPIKEPRLIFTFGGLTSGLSRLQCPKWVGPRTV